MYIYLFMCVCVYYLKNAVSNIFKKIFHQIKSARSGHYFVKIIKLFFILIFAFPEDDASLEVYFLFV